MEKNPILLDIPFPILTPRLLLRPPQIGEGSSLNEAIVESIEEQRPWLPWANEIPTVEQSEQNVREAGAKWIKREDLRLSIWDRSTNAFLGSTGLHRIDWKIPKFEIGYWIRTSAAGKGLITESTNALTQFAFKQLKAKRVAIHCNPHNLRSQAVAKKLGYDLEGCLRNSFYHPGKQEAQDNLIFSRINLKGLPPLVVSWG